MKIQYFYGELRRYNGLEVSVRLNEATLDGTFVRSEQIVGVDKSQVKIILQLSDIDETTYRIIQRSLGSKVSIRVGDITASFMLDSVSTLHMDDRFESEKDAPFSLTFSEPKEELVIQESPGKLVKDLKAAGFLTIADNMEKIMLTTHKPLNQKLTQAIQILRSKSKYVLADRLDTIRTAMFSLNSVEDNKLANLTSHVQTLVANYIPEAADTQVDNLIQSLVQVLKPILDRAVADTQQVTPCCECCGSPKGSCECVCEEPTACEAPMEEILVEELPCTNTTDMLDMSTWGNESNAIGPGFESPYVRSPQTVRFNPEAPIPQRTY